MKFWMTYVHCRVSLWGMKVTSSIPSHLCYLLILLYQCMILSYIHCWSCLFCASQIILKMCEETSCANTDQIRNLKDICPKEGKVHLSLEKEYKRGMKNETWCCVEGMKEADGRRPMKKHFPQHNKSTVFGKVVEKACQKSRVEWDVSKTLAQRKHFPSERN